MTRWSPQPKGEPQHRETRPSRLRCDVGCSTPSTIDKFESNDAGITLEVEFTEGTAQPAYDNGKRRDTGSTGSGLAAGEVTGIGAQGYWASEKAPTLGTRLSYVVAVQDSNVSVRVRLVLSRADGEPPVSWEELGSVAKSEAQMALDRLKNK